MRCPAWPAVGLAFLLAPPASVRADVAEPGDERCTIEQVQAEHPGRRCVACQGDLDENDCSARFAREGLVEVCNVGGGFTSTHLACAPEPPIAGPAPTTTSAPVPAPTTAAATDHPASGEPVSSSPPSSGRCSIGLGRRPLVLTHVAVSMLALVAAGRRAHRRLERSS